MRFTIIIGLSMALTGFCPPRAWSQAEQPQPSRVFQQLFPNPTGQNAYEDFIRAGDLLKNSAAFRAAQGEGMSELDLSLSKKREFLSDPGVSLALSLVRSGVKKPVRSPHETLDDETIMPEMALYRVVARALSVEMYVLLADGKVSQAISALADGLTMSYLVHSDTLINGLVAIAMDAIVIKTVSDHLEQLSSRDCDRLIAVANDWLKTPDPGVAIMARERINMMKILDKYRPQPSKFASLLDSGQPGTPQRAEHDKLVAKLNDSNPISLAPVFDQVAARANAYYDQVDANMQRPIWERTELREPVDDGSLTHQILKGVLPAMSRVLDRYGVEQARVQLLGIHAAIRRYRWENNMLPNSLDQLKLGRLGIDPFSGKPFVYKRTDDRNYDLSSIGAMDQSSADIPSTRARVPIR